MAAQLTSLAVIGCGNMGSAIVRGLVRANVLAADSVSVSDHSPEKVDALVKDLGVKNAGSDYTFVSSADAVLVAVKPPAFSSLLQELVPHYQSVRKPAIISVVSGTRVKTIRDALGADTDVVRVMPNMPCLIGQGISGIYSDCVGDILDSVSTIFKSVGEVVVLEKEDALDVVTGLSASGPGFVFPIIEALADGGVKMGLSREASEKLAVHTVLGSASLVIETGKHPAQLKDMITSPGGTTIAGLHKLEEGKFRANLISAVEAATKRANELQKA